MKKHSKKKIAEKRSDKSSTIDLPRYSVNGRALWDLEMLLNGGFEPLTGYMTQEEYESVRDTMRLPNGILWPMPVVLDVQDDFLHKPGERVVLTDSYGYPLAVLTITDVYTPDKDAEVRHVYGTNDSDHFGVRYVQNELGSRYVGGSVERIALPRQSDFQTLRHTPDELRTYFKEKKWDKVVAFQTRNPMHRAHVELVRQAAQAVGAKVLVHPVVGMTKDGDIDYMTRVRSYEKLIEHHLHDVATLSLLPLAMRMAGPREALWHALIRKNYGVTHFIVGRDHAGPGTDAKGVPFYDPYAAQELVRAHEKEVGVTMLTPQEMVYVKERKSYVPIDEVKKDETVMKISGTEFRDKLRSGETIPGWFSYPEVVSELTRSMARATEQAGYVFFFTGLSGSGKSTVAEALKNTLMERLNRDVTFLDGDVVRLNLSKGLGFSKEDRNTNVERIGFVAGEVARHGGISICSAIAPYEESRAHNRERISALGAYIEIYMSTPIDVCKKRDAKGLYEKAEKGMIKGFTGVDDPYESPVNAEIILDTSELTVEECVARILDYCSESGIMPRVS